MRNDYGVGAALSASLNMYRQASRATGRTNHMIDCLKDGDRVIFLTQKEARRVERICKERKIDVNIRVCGPSFDSVLQTCETRRGVTHFDHAWIEAFYETMIEHARQDLAGLQQAVSKAVERPEPVYRHKFEAYNG